MHFARGNCGHLKAKWDNHPSSLSYTACTRISPSSICSSWTDEVWNLAEKRRLYATRKYFMTQRRKQKKSKKTKKSQSDLSDSGTFDGSTAPQSYTARGRTHQGGSLGDLKSDRALSPPVTSQPVIQSLVNQSPVNQSPGNLSPVIHSLVIQSPVIQSLVNQSSSHRSASHLSTRHQSTSHQSTRHQSTRH